MKKNFLITILIFCVFNVYGVICLNDVNCVFQESDEKSVIEDNIVEGSALFLQSKSYVDLILMEYEKSEKQPYNITLVNEYVGKAIVELEASIVKYKTAKEIGEKLGYDNAKIESFRNFNYDEYIAANELNVVIASNVELYLSKCDVIGLYGKNIENLEDILRTLNTINQCNSKPGVKVLWNLLHRYANGTLFGNYSTMIGRQILGKCDD